MSIFRRRPTLPAALRPPLAPGERVLAWAALPGEQVVVATNLGLWLPDLPSNHPTAALDRTEGPSNHPTAALDRTEGPSNHPTTAPDRTEGPSDHPTTAQDRTAGRLGWHEIHKVAWSGRELRITPAEVAEVREAYAVLVDAPIVSYLLLEPGELPDQVRTRVTRSVAYTAHHALPVGGVRVVGRRVSGVDGLSWAVRYDSGTPADAEPVVKVTDELVRAAQSAAAPTA